MSRSMLLLAVPHEIQGPQFLGYTKDQSYMILLEQLIREVNFVFEEAAGHRPSIAEERAKSILGPGHYGDIDPPASERPKFGIAEKTHESGPIDPWNSTDSFTEQLIDEHRKREKLWQQRIQAQHFEKGLVICGVAHSLSFAFRLKDAGISVRVNHYLPYYKLYSKPQPQSDQRE